MKFTKLHQGPFHHEYAVAQDLGEMTENTVIFDPEQFAYLVTDGEETLFACYADEGMENIMGAVDLCDCKL